MESGKLVGTLGALMVLCVLFTLAVPRGRPSDPAAGAAAREVPSLPAPAERARSAPSLAEATKREPLAAGDLVDGAWRPQGFGFRLPAPEGWRALRRRERPYLIKDPAQMLAGNFNLITLPNLFGRDLQGLLEENRAELTANEQFELHDSRVLRKGARELLRVDYSGVPRGGSRTRFVGLIWLSGSQQVVLTFTVDEQRWPELAPELERCVEGLAFDPPADGR